MVQCGADELAFYNITYLDTQNETDCKDPNGNDRYN